MNELQLISLVLSIGTVVSPVLFGFTLWKMSQYFVNKASFDDHRRQMEVERATIMERVGRIDANVIDLLQRTAANRGAHRD
jgi:hypothetical protein